MKRNQGSITALGIAMARAVESEKPAGERICYDPYARRFFPSWLYYFFAIFIKTGYAEWRGPGVLNFLVARERFIDDVLTDTLNQNLEQVVILGAGYDSRAYRFENLKKGRVRVFEVDFPTTQADKVTKLARIFGQAPNYVTFVPVDFNTQKLEDRLIESGYDPGLKTLFIWQGVTMYLSRDAVDATLAFVERCSPPGSTIVFDYIHRSVLEGAQKHGEVSSMRRYRFMTGEGLTFGIGAGEAEAFLKARGLTLVSEVQSGDLELKYFIGALSHRKVASGYGIVVAKV